MTCRAAEQGRADDRSDRTRIRRAVRVPAYAPINRAYIEARAASNAVERLAHDRIGQHRAAPVVENHDVNLARPVDFRLAPRSIDEVRVGRQLLAGRGAREN